MTSVVDRVQGVALATPNAAVGWAAYGHALEEAERRSHERREGRLARALRKLSPDVDASGQVVLGDPVTSLLRASASVDLLVLGSRGYGPLRRVLLGGVSGQVVRGASCPVVVVPRPQAARDGGDGVEAAARFAVSD